MLANLKDESLFTSLKSDHNSGLDNTHSHFGRTQDPRDDYIKKRVVS